MQLDVAFDWFARQNGHLESGFGDPGKSSVVFLNSARMTFGQSPALHLFNNNFALWHRNQARNGRRRAELFLNWHLALY